MWLIKASLKNPYMVATIVFMIVFLGYLSLKRIPTDILPVFRTPAVQVLTYYQGMPASSIEKTITNRVERWVTQSPGAETVESRSVPGVSVVKIFFRDDTDPSYALTMTTSLAQGTLPTLPPNTLAPVVLPFDPTATMPLGILTVSNPRLDEAGIKDLARIDVRNMLGKVPGCVAPVVVGGKDRTILVYLNPRKMEVRRVSPLDVVTALQKGNLMVSPGTAYFGDNQVLLDTNGMVDKVAELNNLPIRTVPGDSVLLRDVGRAEDSYSIQTSRVLIDGKPEVYIPIYRQQGASSLDVANGVEAFIKRVKKEKSLPLGTELTFIMDQSVFVRSSIDNLIEEGIIGGTLVGVMILVFLGNWRMTLIAGLSIPLSVLGAIIGLYVTGNTINTMTLCGLGLAVGPLVDDAIVELENNHRNYQLGKSRIRAALDGCAEVMVPVMVATCTTNIVLFPIALMPGMGGFLFKPLALAVTFAMITSFLLSRTFVPMMCAKFLPDEHRGAHGGHGPRTLFGRLHHRFEHGLDRVNRGYASALQVAMRHRGKVLGLVGLLFIGSLLLLFGIGQEFFPQVDTGQITIFMRAPSNLRLDAAEKRVKEVEGFIRTLIPPEQIQKQGIVSELGLDPDWSAAYTANAGQQDSIIRVQLVRKKQTRTTQQYAILLRHALAESPNFTDPRWQTSWKKAKERLDARFASLKKKNKDYRPPNFADLRFSFDTGGMVSTALNFGASSPIDVEISGLGRKREAIQESLEFAQRARERIATVRGAQDVRIAQRLDAPYLVINVDRLKAASVGLSTQEVILQVVAAMNSSVSINRNFWIDTESNNQYFVAVQYAANPDMQVQDVLNIWATGTNQPATVKLRSLVDVKRRNDAVEINHVSLYRTFDVMVNTENRDIAGVARDVSKKLDDLTGTYKITDSDLETVVLRDRYDQAGRLRITPAELNALNIQVPPNEQPRVTAKELKSLYVRGFYDQGGGKFQISARSFLSLLHAGAPEPVLVKLQHLQDSPSFWARLRNRLIAPTEEQRFRAMIDRAFDEVEKEASSPGEKASEELVRLLGDKDERERLRDLVLDHTNVYKPPGVRLELKGEYGRMKENFKQLALGLLAATVLVYLLQVALFRSWVGPFIIMFTVPLGLIGVLAMLFVTGTTLNVQSQMGVIFLVGIAVNNGVLLVDFANKQRYLGSPVAKAIAQAATIRFRPILMTFLATFLDLIPMAYGVHRGDEMTVPLARAVVGGLLTSTPLTLFVVPILYTLLLRDPLPSQVNLEVEISDPPELTDIPPNAWASQRMKDEG